MGRRKKNGMVFPSGTEMTGCDLLFGVIGEERDVAIMGARIFRKGAVSWEEEF
ncbi:MAG: hypothetical protein SWE60_13865 [Thermodesulfobacteriota bacterium]|nr:hypothetical protein [Thermodesulfobacteriota bacterium]